MPLFLWLNGIRTFTLTMPIAAPQLGEVFVLGKDKLPTAKWWEGLK